MILKCGKKNVLYICFCHSGIRGRSLMHIRQVFIEEVYCMKQRCHKESGLGSCISIAAGCAATMKTILIHQDYHLFEQGAQKLPDLSTICLRPGLLSGAASWWASQNQFLHSQFSHGGDIIIWYQWAQYEFSKSRSHLF